MNFLNFLPPLFFPSATTTRFPKTHVQKKGASSSCARELQMNHLNYNRQFTSFKDRLFFVFCHNELRLPVLPLWFLINRFSEDGFDRKTRCDPETALPITCLDQIKFAFERKKREPPFG